MSEEKPSMEEGAPEVCPESGCPICRALSPKSTVGRVVLLVVVLGLVAFLLLRKREQTPVEQLIARYDKARAEGRAEDVKTAQQQLLLIGNQLLAAKDYDQAKQALQAVIEREPDTPYALARLAIVALYEGDVDRALGYHRRAAEIDPETPAHHYNIAHILYYKKQDYAGCEKVLPEAMKRATKAQYLLLYALCAEKLGRDEAEIVKRLRNTISTAEVQMQTRQTEEVAAVMYAAGGSLEQVVLEAARRLEGHGQSFGWDRLAHVAAESSNEEAGAFAKRLLTLREKPME